MCKAFPGRAVASLEDIHEVERSPQRLVWWIENDTWVRYVVHCYALCYNIVPVGMLHGGGYTLRERVHEQVVMLLPVPVLFTKPVENPRVYPDPCSLLYGRRCRQKNTCSIFAQSLLSLITRSRTNRYQVRFSVLQAGVYGSPQHRPRVIFWGAWGLLFP